MLIPLSYRLLLTLPHPLTPPLPPCLTSAAQGLGKLKAWLDELDCGVYFSKFVDAGYDFG